MSVSEERVEDSKPTAMENRHAAIQEILLEHREVSVQELVDRFSVSLMTVHRDLDALEKRGILRKVRGGATAQPSTLYESSVQYRIGENQAAKRDIGRAAAAHIEPGMSIAIDDSTTALAMLPFIAEIPQLTILTNFLSVIDRLRSLPGDPVEVIFVGGKYRPKYNSFGGLLAENWIKDFRVDKCFISVSAIDLERGPFHQETDQAAVKRAMIDVSAEANLLCDASKFSRRAMHRIVDFDSFDRVIVDQATPADVVLNLRSRGLTVEVAGVGGNAAETMDGKVPK